MIKLYIKQPTYLKQDVKAADKLPEQFKQWVTVGSYELESYSNSTKNHIKVTFKTPQGKYKTWLVFADHVAIDDPNNAAISLNVPYYSQRDNQEEYWRTCNTSSHAMLLNYLYQKYTGKNAVSGDDEYFQKFVKPYGDSTDWYVHTQALRKFGIESEYRTNCDFDDIDRSLKAGIPFVMGILHKGSIQSPSGGHVIICIGKDGDEYICHDPWGEGFSYTNHNGKAVKYPVYPSLESRWLLDLPNNGYGRIITSVKGQKTGL